MRTALTSAAVLALALVPAAARADALGCLVGPSDVSRCSVSGAPAALLGAVAVPVLVAGAAVSVAHELAHRAQERPLDAAAAAPAGKHAVPNLALVPTPPDPYRAPAGKTETRRKPSGAFQFNEAATNVTTVVAGAMVAGAVIATIVEGARKK